MDLFKSVGIIHSEKKFGDKHYPFNVPAKIEINKELINALDRLDENSHIWVICLYTPIKKPSLKVKPQRVNSKDSSFGVFALRSPNHPNPISLSLAKLDKIEKNIIYVDNLDAYDGTEVLDIKPYHEYDSIFSIKTSNIVHDDRMRRKNALCELALNYHKEKCVGSALAIKMVLYLEYQGIFPLDEGLRVSVNGDSCIADVLQGLCRARLSNPPRFLFKEDEKTVCEFKYKGKVVIVELKNKELKNYDEVLSMNNDKLFIINHI